MRLGFLFLTPRLSTPKPVNRVKSYYGARRPKDGPSRKQRVGVRPGSSYSRGDKPCEQHRPSPAPPFAAGTSPHGRRRPHRGKDFGGGSAHAPGPAALSSLTSPARCIRGPRPPASPLATRPGSGRARRPAGERAAGDRGAGCVRPVGVGKGRKGGVGTVALVPWACRRPAALWPRRRALCAGRPCLPAALEEADALWGTSPPPPPPPASGAEGGKPQKGEIRLRAIRRTA